MNLRKLNWPAWAGFLLTLVAFLSYFFVFVSFPVTRDFPWVNLLLFAFAALLLLIGLRRAFASDRPRPRLAKVAGLALVTVSVAVFGCFIFITLINGRRLPASHSAPQVSQKAPDFALADTTGKPVSLSELLSSSINGKPTRGVLLIFYRGYW